LVLRTLLNQYIGRTQRESLQILKTKGSLSFRELQDRIPAVLYEFVVDKSGKWHFAFLSKQVEQIYEVSPEEAYADHNALTSCIIPEDREAHRLSVIEALANLDNWSHLHRIRTPKGKLKWIQAQATAKTLPKGGVKWFGVLTDVTRYVESKQSVFQLIQTCERRLQSRRLFIDEELAELDLLRIKVLGGKQDANQTHHTAKSTKGTPGVSIPTPKKTTGESVLSSREKEILKLIGTGATTREIAEITAISMATVSVHRRNIRRKLGVKSAADVTRYALLKYP